MPISDLPNEIILQIADQIDSEKDVLLLARLDRRLYGTVIDYLYRRNARDSHASALLWAAKHGEEATAQQALANGASVCACNNRHETHLHVAAKAGQDRLVRLFLDHGVDVNSLNAHMQTPLVLAARGGHETLVRLLLDQPRIEPIVGTLEWWHCKNLEGLSPLCHAARYGHAGVVRVLLDSERVNVNWPNAIGLTPLYFAAMRGHEEVVKILTRVPGIQLNARSHIGMTPLLCALMEGHERVAWLLLETEGVDVHAVAENSNTALSLATARGLEKIVKVLLMRGCNPHYPDQYGFTPLDMATNAEHDSIVQLIKEAMQYCPRDPAERRRSVGTWLGAHYGSRSHRAHHFSSFAQRQPSLSHSPPSNGRS
ncbi:ankyrin repeat-containing domain protein [Aspergillus avenaceus]|uniref:Ankyrin repeat-containing domain protein n=1 Tax=Aspergillus avenaceus TaxID=36643 RepID=A0A5N6U5B3_ASPAV|nr:ankyrin repeat-containing domain protein [Aspergillus avenaceus]